MFNVIGKNSFYYFETSKHLEYICERLTHKHKYNMELEAIQPQKKASYRFYEMVLNIPNGRLTQEKAALASQLGVSIFQLNRIIRGGSEPNGTQLLIIAKFFGVPVSDLYENEEARGQSAADQE